MGEQADLLLNGDACEGCGEDDGDYSDIEWANDARKERRKQLEPPRMSYAKKQLTEMKVKHVVVAGGDQLAIEFDGKRIDFWPFTGWFCGRKPIGNIKGRGIANLIKEIKKCTPIH